MRLYGVGLRLGSLVEALQACLRLPVEAASASSACSASHQLPVKGIEAVTQGEEGKGEEGETGDQEGGAERDESSEPACPELTWVAGRVGHVRGGAPQLAALFRDTDLEAAGGAGPPCHVLHWRASWIEPCRPASLAFER